MHLAVALLLVLGSAPERKPMVVATSPQPISHAAIDATHAYWSTAQLKIDPIGGDEECVGGALWRAPLATGKAEKLLDLKTCPAEVLRVAGHLIWFDGTGTHAWELATRKTRDLDPTPVWNDRATDGKELFVSDGEHVVAIDPVTAKKRTLKLPAGRGWHGLAWAESTGELVTARFASDKTELLALDVRTGNTRFLGKHPDALGSLSAGGKFVFAVGEKDGANPELVAAALEGGWVKEVHQLPQYQAPEFVLTVADAKHLYACDSEKIFRIDVATGALEKLVAVESCTQLLQDSTRVYWVDERVIRAATK